MNDEKLQEEEEWDFGHAEALEPARKQRAVVSVSFGADEFDAVSDYARSAGMKLSTFIRSAALDKARGGIISARFVLQLSADRSEEILLNAPTGATYSLSEQPLPRAAGAS